MNILRGLPLPIYGDGRNVRDWLHVERSLPRHRAGPSRTARPARSTTSAAASEAENIALVTQLCDLVEQAFADNPALPHAIPMRRPRKGLQARSLITFVKDRAGHDRRYAIDSSKAERELGYQGALHAEQGLRETVAWYLANEEWWRAVLGGDYQKHIARKCLKTVPVSR